MKSYLIRRIAGWLPVLFFSSIIVFLVVRALPGDLADILAGSDASQSDVQLIRQQYGFDQSWPVQYLQWIKHMVKGDFGVSYTYHRENREIIFSRLPNSLLVALSSLLIALIGGIPFGLLAGLKPGSWFDNTASFLTSLVLATPNFWFGLLAILFASVMLGWLPPGGFVSWEESPAEFIQSLILPALTLALHPAAVLVRFTRNAVNDTLHENFVRAAYAKGLSRRRIISRHILRNALLPVVTIAGILFGRMVGGSIVVETVFAWPGIGRLLVQAIINRDYGMVQGILLVLVALLMVINLIVDLVYSSIDPRIHLTKRGK
ncbi:ABC transporter permease [Rahnella sp. L72c]|uniref:ABC transporter permease n=1 Tax=Rahnella perminowiae TaxID=2816244 RepID=A0ABS6KVE9_9GAMM|nr:ABC transporter permease [Rahnella perminowiae]MBU9833581.1 ABC transporter permease [Rahnella perminowiae]